MTKETEKYEASSFWNSRYQRFDLTTSGHIDLPFDYNYWMYELKKKKVKPVYEHDWQKTSLVTERGGYDRYTCSKCGATGKRWGLSEYITPDKASQKHCKVPD